MYLPGHFQIPDKACIPNPNRYLLSYQVKSGVGGEHGSQLGTEDAGDRSPLAAHFSAACRRPRAPVPISLLGTSTTLFPDIPTWLPHRPLTPFLPCPGACGTAGRWGWGAGRMPVWDKPPALSSVPRTGSQLLRGEKKDPWLGSWQKDRILKNNNKRLSCAFFPDSVD